MEELKLILDTLANLGAAGKDAFIWWLVFDKLIPMLVLLVGIVLAFMVLFRLVGVAASNCYVERLRDLMGVGTPGILTKGECKEMEEWVLERNGKTKGESK